MSNALRTTINDLARSLDKALSGSRVERQLRNASSHAAGQLLELNRQAHPGLQAKLTKVSSLSYSITLSAPDLWSSVYGSMTQDGNGLETRVLASHSKFQGET